MESKRCGVLDTPLEPVIGLAEGETRWRGMTAWIGAAPMFIAPLPQGEVDLRSKSGEGFFS